MARLEICCSDEQKKELEKKAKTIGLKLSPFLVFVGLNARIDIQVGAYPFIHNLTKLQELKEKGAVTDEEFKNIKKDIMEQDSKSIRKLENKNNG